MTDTTNSPAIRWDRQSLALLDQRHLPAEETWIHCSSHQQVADAIRDMVVRGAPAIGISAAYGIALAARALGDHASEQALAEAFDSLAASRPTAVNLFWALDSMRAACAGNHQGEALVQALMARAEAIHADDVARNQALGDHGAALLPEQASLYTHCNTGALATGGHGTALGIIRSAWQQGRLSGVYAGETRPWMQGARLTAWELQQDSIPVTLVTDSCAAHLMAQGKVDAVVVGADRITANGDTANKIGTYGLAVLARHHDIPFYVAAPCSTVDMNLSDGDQIVIEQRSGDEIVKVGSTPMAPAGTRAYNPVFDVTPAALISAIITERGVLHSPNATTLRDYMKES